MQRSPNFKGMILPVIVLLGLVVGAFAVAFHHRTRHRNAQVRRGRDRVLAKYLSRAGIDLVQHGMREARRRAVGTAHPDTASGALTAWLLDPPARLLQKLEQETGGREDHRKLLVQLLGAETFVPLERLETRHPEARFSLRLELTAEPLPGTPAVVDPVLKTVSFQVVSTVKIGAVQWAWRLSEPVWVHSLLPRGASRFTLSLPNGCEGHHEIDEEGDHRAGPAPVVLFHHPGDADPMATDLFGSPGVPGPGLGVMVNSPDDMWELAASRGLLFVGSGTAAWRLAGGGQPFGEAPFLGRPATNLPAPRLAAAPVSPAAFAAFRPADPTRPGPTQAAVLETGVMPFGPGTLRAVGGAPPRLELVAASRLKAYGTPAHPSPTVVVGPARRILALASRIAVDRDATDQDEATQRSELGRDLPVGDGAGPVLQPVSPEVWAGDLAAEATGAPFSPDGLAAFPGTVPDRNVMADLDGDGHRETPVTSEQPFDPIALDRSAWTWSRLFESFEEYRRFMSREVRLPANAVLHLASLAPETAQERLARAFVGSEGDSELDAFEAVRVLLVHRDPLHAGFGGAGGIYIDTRDGDPDDLRRSILTGMNRRHPGEEAIRIHGQALFEQHFLRGDVLDLDGMYVEVLPEDRPDPPPLLIFGRPIQIRPGSGGILSTPMFQAPTLTNPGAGETFAPFVLLTQQLVMTGPGPFEAAISATRIAFTATDDRVLIRGPTLLPDLPPDLTVPLIVQYDPRYDPTGPDAARSYRIEMPWRSSRIYDVVDLP